MADTQHKIFESKLFSRCTVKHQSFIGDLLEVCPRDVKQASMGYVPLRQAHADAAMDAVEACFLDGSLNPDIVRLGSFVFKDGHTDIDAPLPNLKTQAGRIDALCRQFGLSAFILPDIEVIKFRGYSEPLLSHHHHALIWNSDGTPIKPKTLTKAMNQRLSAQTLVMPPALISADVEGQSAIDKVRAMAGYASKITCRLKTVWWDDDGYPHVQASTRNMTEELTLRLLHAWSKLDLLENVRGVGDAKALRKFWKECLEERLKTVRGISNPKLAGADQLSELWSAFWSQAGLPALSLEQIEARAEKFARIVGLADEAGELRHSRSDALLRIRQALRDPFQSTLKDL